MTECAEWAYCTFCHLEGYSVILKATRKAGTGMVKVEATVARNGFSDLISKVQYGSERVLIERRGKDVAALISVADLHLLEMLEDQIDIEAARQALANPKNKLRVPLDQVKKRLGL